MTKLSLMLLVSAAALAGCSSTPKSYDTSYAVTYHSNSAEAPPTKDWPIMVPAKQEQAAPMQPVMSQQPYPPIIINNNITMPSAAPQQTAYTTPVYMPYAPPRRVNSEGGVEPPDAAFAEKYRQYIKQYDGQQ